MKKVLLIFVALITMSLAAKATEYTGTVSNIHMGSKTPDDIKDISFDVTNNVLTGDIDVPVFPPHHIDLTAPLSVTGSTFTGDATGTVTVFFVNVNFSGYVTGSALTDTSLIFHCTATTSTGTNVSFDFSGIAN